MFNFRNWEPDDIAITVILTVCLSLLIFLILTYDAKPKENNCAALMTLAISYPDSMLIYVARPDCVARIVP